MLPPQLLLLLLLLLFAACTQLHGDISLFLSHDWPNEITRYGDKARLFKKKPYFQQEVGACVSGWCRQSTLCSRQGLWSRTRDNMYEMV